MTVCQAKCQTTNALLIELAVYHLTMATCRLGEEKVKIKIFLKLFNFTFGLITL